MNNESFKHDVETALSHFSDHIKGWVKDYYYDAKSSQKVILLNDGANLKKFCHLLAATNVFNEDDEELVVRF